MKENRPVIGITMGDAAGVGPEIIVKALASDGFLGEAAPLVIGDARRLALAAKACRLDLAIRQVSSVGEAQFSARRVNVVDIACIPEDLPWGRVSAQAGDGAFQFIERAVYLAMSGDIDAICTAPLNKEALHKAGHDFPGHTELLAHLSHTDEVSMMLTAPGLRVIHVTTHLGLVDAVHSITPERVYRTIRRGHDLLTAAGADQPRIAVCGVNPHAGEHGLFGNREEERQIAPGVQKARDEGIDAVGPLPADTVFGKARQGGFDLVVAQYHDQGHIPVKLLGLQNGVNVTVGLPFVRTSVDHGTAFDIAGRGIADERPLLAAYREAVALAASRTQQIASTS
ncbi:MAG TPA: 4-hydroxythreonine-4-phosphate dehydrogenase PdxA [Microbacteriaceae bacterium]|nr:4-hydroxythreonine-4-phosphate dehydrogenase PdxA [Microbacteriaceae bacterium]